QIELWCEKSTMNDILLPLCERDRMNLVTGVGEMSITSIQKLIERIRKPTRIFYISDYDPGGQSMPVAVARKIEFILHESARKADIRLYPLALTAEQINRLHLPRIPIKDSETRKASFERRHGVGATELDALEALYPGELARIVKEAVSRYRDPTLGRRLLGIEIKADRQLEELNEAIRERYGTEIEEAEDQWQEIGDVMAEWSQKFHPLWQRMSRDLARSVSELAWDYPEPVLAEEIADPLFDSHRDYFEQLQAYKKFQRKDNGDR
ncbi:MAG: hypothetical protein ACRD1T_21420, partial [Acidimicrobiia bacterium]